MNFFLYGVCIISDQIEPYITEQALSESPELTIRCEIREVLLATSRV
jgi:hypothetical protein